MGQFSQQDDSAAGRMELCQWRSNPQMELYLEGDSPIEVAISLVRYAKDSNKGTMVRVHGDS